MVSSPPGLSCGREATARFDLQFWSVGSSKSMSRDHCVDTSSDEDESVTSTSRYLSGSSLDFTWPAVGTGSSSTMDPCPMFSERQKGADALSDDESSMTFMKSFLNYHDKDINNTIECLGIWNDLTIMQLYHLFGGKHEIKTSALSLISNASHRYLGETDGFGMMQGWGYLNWSCGSNYTGHFQRNQLHGLGRLVKSNGECYIGHWRQGVKSGVGIIRFTTGDLYYGEWANDSLHGNGILSFLAPKDESKLDEAEIPKWSIYRGKFINDEISGVGKMIYNYGDVYDGEWSNGVPDGQGVMQYCNQIYGDAVGNNRVADSNDENFYDGTWHVGRKHGLGRFVSVCDQLQYYGEWSVDNFHGDGVLFDNESVIYDGEWNRGWPCDSTDDVWPKDAIKFSGSVASLLSWRMQIIKNKLKGNKVKEIAPFNGVSDSFDDSNIRHGPIEG